MNLNLFNNLNKIKRKNEEAHVLLNELKEKIDMENNNLGILEDFQSKNKIAIGTKNQMERKMDEILLDYSSKTIKDGDLYYIVEYLKEEDSYVVYKYDGKEDSVLKIKKEELPNEASVNTALRIKEGSYIIDETATIELKEKVTNMANELLEEQNKLLEGYRKEGHLYKVSENINGSVFIYDITDDPKIEIEEVDFPEELKEIAHEGTVFEYIDGKYRIKTTDK